MGSAYAAQGMTNEAVGAYERMLELNPDESLRAWVEQWKVQAGYLVERGGRRMISLHKLNGFEFVVNAELLEVV